MRRKRNSFIGTLHNISKYVQSTHTHPQICLTNVQKMSQFLENPEYLKHYHNMIKVNLKRINYDDGIYVCVVCVRTCDILEML